jgi:L-histidine N-alpha-methyltransferase
VKSTEQMLIAYDDPTGVTAAFNLNLLGRINRELSADFDLRQFQHESRWDERERRIEMHLRSRRDQIVHVREADLNVRFQSGETIWTESSHKFHAGELPEMAERCGYRAACQWVDREWPFVESLWLVT